MDYIWPCIYLSIEYIWIWNTSGLEYFWSWLYSHEKGPDSYTLKHTHRYNWPNCWLCRDFVFFQSFCFLSLLLIRSEVGFVESFNFIFKIRRFCILLTCPFVSLPIFRTACHPSCRMNSSEGCVGAADARVLVSDSGVLCWSKTDQWCTVLVKDWSVMYCTVQRLISGVPYWSKTDQCVVQCCRLLIQLITFAGWIPSGMPSNQDWKNRWEIGLCCLILLQLLKGAITW